MVVVLIIMLHERIQTQEGLNFVLSGITTAKNRATWHIELQKNWFINGKSVNSDVKLTTRDLGVSSEPCQLN